MTTIPDEFKKIILDFSQDVSNSFPEFVSLYLTTYINTSNESFDISDQNLSLIFDHCKQKFPPHFFDILYKNDQLFSQDNDSDAHFLPSINFKQLFHSDASDSTKEALWKYLQLILFTIITDVSDHSSFGDAAKLFEAINEDELKSKMEEVMKQMHNIFEQPQQSGENESEIPTGMPNPEEIHEHISGLLGGKIGNLAKEIAEETAKELDINIEDESSVKSVFQNLFKNPVKLMSLVKKVGKKLDSKLKSGEIKESELMQEASDMLNKMKKMPGVGNMANMFKNMGMDDLPSMAGLANLAGMGGRQSKLNIGAMQSQLQKNIKTAKMKERMQKKIEDKKNVDSSNELIFSTGEVVEKTPRFAKPFTDQELEAIDTKEKKKKKKNKQ